MILEEYIRQILNEVDLKVIQKYLNKNKVLPFENVFKGKLRMVIPYETSSFNDLKKLMKKEGYEVDFANKKAYITKTSRDGKQNKVELRLGKAIANLIRMKEKNGEDSEELDKLKDLYKKYGEESSNYSSYEKGTQYSIVLTRAPIDVLKMSDWKALKSCHSQGGEFWHCAVQEAQSGGAIAYLVNSNDIEGLDMEAPEIFSDKDREIDGITPLGRIRIRNFSSTNFGKNGSLAVPELRMYGVQSNDFRSSVLGFLQEAQPEFNKENLPEPQDVTLKGGGYQDNKPYSLLNDFFETNVYDRFDPFQYEKGQHDNRDERGRNIPRNAGRSAESLATSLVNEIEATINQTKSKILSYYVDSDDGMDDGDVYVRVNITLNVNISQEIYDILSDLDHRELKDIFVEACKVFDIEDYINKYDIQLERGFGNGIGGYISTSIEDDDLSIVVTQDFNGHENIISSIEHYDSKTDDVEHYKFEKIIRNILIRDYEDIGLNNENALNVEHLESTLKNFSFNVDNDIESDNFGQVFAEVQLDDIGNAKDEKLRYQVKQLVSYNKFAEDFWESVLNRFSPNLNQLILPNVEYGEPPVSLSIPVSAGLKVEDNKIFISVSFNLEEDDSEQFVDFLETIDKNIETLRDMFVNLVQDKLGL